ncbi:MAG: NADH-quinone oxidoreductase subunit N [Microthrixaceae bacterium]|nr:NADH-quinone oxidoreductase subunit N [Microthrixaceae bacterium]MCO5312171.1 NADH-quinone oxidoreductase subunit N [Microthrixaceae bacterium]HPB45335.1 NADH-quinone oxidoreductase subunit N [Microthrixaceae bacterium]
MLTHILQDPGITPISADGVELATPKIEWGYMTPLLVLFVGVVVFLVAMSLIRKMLTPAVAAGLTIVIAAASLVSTIPLWRRVENPAEGPIGAIGGVFGVDRFSLYVTGLICVAVILVALLLADYMRREEIVGPELFLLMILSAAGGVIMAGANDLIVLFIGLEVLSISAYVMCAIHDRRLSSQEAGFKYFVLGGFASAFLLYGVAMVYGATGSTSLLHISDFLADNLLEHDGLLLAGLALMLVGFGFKIAGAPFHMWAPDVYQGAPSPISGFMSSAVKVAAFAGLLRVFVVGFSTQAEQWRPIVFAIAVLSMLVGAIMAVTQTNVKRMLAYSSINHAGFILLGVEAATARGTSASLFYLAAYTVMTIGSFGVVTLVGRKGDGRHNLSDYRGLGHSRPGVALVFTVFLLAQAGTPFTAGFVAKVGVISAATSVGHWAIAIVAMVSATISCFLYLRIVASMFFIGGGDHGDEPLELEGPPVRVPVSAALSLAIALVITVGMGVLPGIVSGWSGDAEPALVYASQD